MPHRHSPASSSSSPQSLTGQGSFHEEKLKERREPDISDDSSLLLVQLSPPTSQSAQGPPLLGLRMTLLGRHGHSTQVRGLPREVPGARGLRSVSLGPCRGDVWVLAVMAAVLRLDGRTASA